MINPHILHSQFDIVCYFSNFNLRHKNTNYLCAKGKIAILVFNILLTYILNLSEKTK